jgi:glycosyltransferase involved in cell wall biosynthesis
MRVTIVHYHLRTGGVTRVIQNALASLNGAQIDAVVIAAEPFPEGVGQGIRVRVVPGLAYDERSSPVAVNALRTQLEDAARDAFGVLPDLWHVHNHALGKNVVLPEVIHRMASDGQRFLLQIHDFAEDGRPGNYRRLIEHLGYAQCRRYLYPVAGHIHYAVLTDRDREILERAGVPPAQLHLLPNAVWLGAGSTPDAEPRCEQRLWLYPTRAIRRKNLGELLLLAALSGERDRFATTRAPENPRERLRYERWVGFAESLHLPVEFELSTQCRMPFEALLRSAYALVTTSIAEGFGLAFLEPWLIGRPLVGRNLPEITGAFRSAGVDLSSLYDRVDVPLEWIGARVLENRIQAARHDFLAAYGRKPADDDCERVFSAWVHNQQVDFGRLDEPLQESIIHRIVASEAGRRQISVRCLQPPSARCVASNGAAVRRSFGLEAYGQRLDAIYRGLLDAGVDPIESAANEAILDWFLAPERLFLLATS